MASFLRKYATGTGADVYIPVIKRAVVDYAVGADWTPQAGDVKIDIDGAGSPSNIGTLPTAVTMGNTAYWKFVLSNTELTGKKMIVTVADSATKAVEDQSFNIETYGHASAMHQFDLNTSTQPVNVTQLLGTPWLAPVVAGTPDVNAKQIGGNTQSATDLRDFADTGYDPATHKVAGVVLVDTTTTNTDMRGTNSAFLASSAPTNFTSLLINASGHVTRVTLTETTTTNTDMRGTDSAALASSLPTNFSALLISASGHVSRVTLADTCTANTDMRGTDNAALASSLAALFTTAMTESYAADGTAPTLAEAIFAIQQRLTDFAITGTTLTVYKIDGSTTAYVITLDSTTPTSSARSA